MIQEAVIYTKKLLKTRNIDLNTLFLRRERIQKPYRVALLLERIKHINESSLITHLNPTASIKRATPSGYVYDKITMSPELSAQSMSIGYFSPHPADLPDFIGGIVNLLGVPVHEILITEGEKGAHPLSEETTRQIRQQESQQEAEMLGILLDSLGKNIVADGEVLSHIPQLIVLVKNKIQEHNLGIIFASAPEIDHPDHVAVHVAVVGALLQLASEGYYKNRPLPAVYITDPEFGFASGSPETKAQVREALPSIYPDHFGLRRGRDYNEDSYPFVIPQFIVDISSSMLHATEALHVHRTQMFDGKGKPKPYVDKIPALKRLRGRQIGTDWGEGLRQFIIEGITARDNLLSHILPNGSMYTLKAI